MRYFHFCLRKVYRNRLLLLPLVLVAVLIAAAYAANRNTVHYTLAESIRSGEQEVKELDERIALLQTGRDEYQESSQEYQAAAERIRTAEQRKQYLQQRLEAYRQKNWPDYYENDLALIRMDIHDLESDGIYYDEELMEVLQNNQNYAQYMLEHRLGYDDRFSPIQGFSFMIQVAGNYMPFILAVVLIYITSTIYCASFFDHLDIRHLLPSSCLKKQGSMLLAGTIVGIAAVLLTVLLPILCSCFGSSIGSVSSPVLACSMDGPDTYIPLFSILPQLVLLTVLSILFIVNFVSVVSLCARKSIICILASLVIIIGSMIITTEIAPIYPIAHILPTTYLNGLQVMSGGLLSVTGNADINFSNGIIVLGLGNLILFAAYYGFSKLHFRGVGKS